MDIDQKGFCELIGIQIIGNQYVFVKQLDKGQFGQVWIGKDVKNNELVAIKQISTKKKNDYNLELVRREINIMKQLEKSENIVEFKREIKEQEYIYIVMELCEQNLHQKICQIRKQKQRTVALEEIEAILYMKQILHGFKSLYKQGVIHRDVKLKNILVKGDTLKLADFGLAIQHNIASSQVGTPYTKAPEVYDGASIYNNKSDIWSLGIIFYQMLFDLNYPFSAKDENELQKKIKQKDPEYNLLGIKISEVTIQLLKQMLEINPKKRIDWDELFNHQYFVSDQDQICALLSLSGTSEDQSKKEMESNIFTAFKDKNNNHTINQDSQTITSNSQLNQKNSQVPLSPEKDQQVLSFLQETLINSFLINKIDDSIKDNQELQKFCSGVQFELSLQILNIATCLNKEQRYIDIFQDYFNEAKLNIIQYLSEPRQLKEIAVPDKQRCLKTLKKYYTSVLAQSQNIYENSENYKAVQLLSHAYDILGCIALLKNGDTKFLNEKIQNSKYNLFFKQLQGSQINYL